MVYIIKKFFVARGSHILYVPFSHKLYIVVHCLIYAVEITFELIALFTVDRTLYQPPVIVRKQ